MHFSVQSACGVIYQPFQYLAGSALEQTYAKQKPAMEMHMSAQGGPVLSPPGAEILFMPGFKKFDSKAFRQPPKRTTGKTQLSGKNLESWRLGN
jgi:hypothetical protein